MLYLKQSTAAEVKIGPFVDATDGFTAETALTISQADVRLAKNADDWGQKNESTAAAHEENGWYRCLLDTTDTNTLGRLVLAVNETGALPVWHEFTVLAANVFDSLIGGGDVLDVSVTQIDGLATNGNNATLNLKQLNIVNSAGSAVIASSTGSNGHGIAASGNGSGEGISATGGATGAGIEAIGGATSGDGIKASCTSGNGVTATGGATGHGVAATSGSGATGDGIKALAASTNGNGLAATGTGTGDGAVLTGGASAGGDGMSCVAGGGAPLASAMCNTIADHAIRRSFANAKATTGPDTKTGRSLLGVISKQTNKVAMAGGTLSSYEEDDTTVLFTQAASTDAAALHVTALDTA